MEFSKNKMETRGKSVLARSDRLFSFLYWLAGARPATLAHLPESERERIAVLGSSVLIPTLLAFFGMFLYASNRFQVSRPIVAMFIAIAWAFVIMNVDRILMATYRPFQPWYRKGIQVCFRIGLAAVISVAIAFPFCLEQYQGAIHERLQGEYRKRLDDLQTKERAEREVLETRDAAVFKELQEKLDKERAAGPVDPQLYAKELAKHDIQEVTNEERTHKQQLDQQTETAMQEWKRASARMREVEQDLKDEAKGKLSADRGGTGKSGQGARFKELTRDLEMLTKVEQAAKRRYEQFLKQTIVVKPAEAGNAPLSVLDEGKRAYFIAEAQERKNRIEELGQAIKKAEDDQVEHMHSHRLRFEPVIKSYRAKAEGRFDPMEETIGLFKVIFVPETDIDDMDKIVQNYKWMAALFQFGIVFGTLFLLDLIAILSKVMSRPGPYDVLVEFPEVVARQNLMAFKKEYPRYADTWVEQTTQQIKSDTQGTGVDLSDTGEVARLLLRAHLPSGEKMDN